MVTPLGMIGGSQQFAIQVTNAPKVTSLLLSVRVALTDTYLTQWMESDVVPYFHDQIVDNWYGGIGGNAWPPLTAATRRIRHQMGVMDDDDINIRSGDMFDHLVTHSQVTSGLGAVQMAIPGDQGDYVMEQKIRTAQLGKGPSTFGPHPTGPTPPRPVLTVNQRDMERVIMLLMMHIMRMVQTRTMAKSGFSASGVGRP